MTTPAEAQTAVTNATKTGSPVISKTILASVLTTIVASITTVYAVLAPIDSPTFTGTPRAPTPAVDTNTTQLSTTAFVLGQAGTANPAMDSTAAPGSSLRYSRQDHVHPTDTSRAPNAFTQSGTGAVATTVDAKLKTMLSIVDFGAVMDGVTDDTAALQAAIAADSGKGVLIPAGSTVLDTTTITTSNHTITCASQNGTAIFAKLVNSTPFSFGNGGATVSNLFINNCSFYSKVGNQTSGSYVIFNNCYNCGAYNVQFSNAYNSIYVAGAQSNYVTIDRSISVGATGDHYLIDTVGGDIQLNRVFSNVGSGSQAASGLHVVSTEGLFVSNSDFVASGKGTWIAPTAGKTVAYLFMSNVAAGDSGSGAALHITPSGGGVVKYLTFNNSWGSSSLVGVLIECPTAGTIDGLYFSNWRSIVPTQQGIAMYCATALHVEFNGGAIIDAGIGAANTYSSVDVIANTSHWSIKNMVLSSGTNTSYTPTAKYAVNIPAGTSDYYQITGNDFFNGFVSGGINDAAAGAHRVIQSNFPNTTDLVKINGSSIAAGGPSPVGTTGSCVASSFVGGTLAGKFSAAVCAAGTIILSSLPAAPNGYTCVAQNQTAPARTLQQTANTTTSVTFTTTTNAADVVAYSCLAW